MRCMECIGQFPTFVCSSRTRERVRLAHTKMENSPLQSIASLFMPLAPPECQAEAQKPQTVAAPAKVY